MSERPQFSEQEPLAERLVYMLTGLATELAVLRERLDTMELLLARQGVLRPGDIDAFEPDAATEAKRRAWREEFIDRLLAELHAEIDAATTSRKSE